MAKFLIAGAGIAGLSAALALSRSNHTVTVLEQAPALSEVGAGIQLGPNAMRILMDWGLGEAIRDKGCEPMHLTIRDARDDRVLTSRALNDLGAAQQKYGAPHVCIRRADLQSVLLQAAQDAGANVLLGQMALGLHESPYFSLADFDALLGCDGLHSKVREDLLAGTQHGGKPRSTGHTAYRAMVDMALLPLELRTQSVQVWLGAAQHVVVYPVNQRQMNIVIAQEGAPSLASPMSAQLHVLIAAVEANGGFTTWELFHRSPMLSKKFYAKGKVALLGDAAHPMLPYLAQGAAMAIEDAQALGHAVASKTNVGAALQAYAKARWQRNARVQIQSQMQGFAFHASGLTRLARDAVLRAAGERLTAMPWLYDYQNPTIKPS
jgi:salicylate hydroxylase